MENTLLKNLLDDATNKVAAYQNGYNNHEKKKVLKGLKSSMTEAIAKYNLELSKAQYKEWMKAGDPVKEAIRNNKIPGAIKTKNKTNDDDVMTCLIVPNDEYFASFPMMQAVLGKDIFSDPDWFKMGEKICKLVADAINSEINGATLFNYDCEEESKEFELPDGCNLMSDKGAQVMIQTLIDKILFIPKEVGTGKKAKVVNAIQITGTREWRTIRESMTYGSGVNEVTICNTSNFFGLVRNAMHGIITNGNFKLNQVASDLHDLCKELADGSEEDAE